MRTLLLWFHGGFLASFLLFLPQRSTASLVDRLEVSMVLLPLEYRESCIFEDDAPPWS